MAEELQTADDIAFIRAILTSPGDIAPRLVYADWLDEHETERSTRAAELLRLLAEFTQVEPDSLRHLEIQARIGQLQEVLPARWVAVLDIPMIEACRNFRYVCPLRWDLLHTTKNAFRRYCSECRVEVHYCHSLIEAAKLAEDGHCIALPMGAIRQPNDLEREIERQKALQSWDNDDGERLVMGIFA